MCADLHGQALRYRLLQLYYTRPFLNTILLPCAGKQDDLAIALQLAMIGCQKFFQDPKYKSFRPDDYHTPLGLANHPQPRGVV